MHFSKDRIPQRCELGDLAAVCWKFPKGTDASSLLAGLPNDMCPCPHWGYVVAGRMVLRYADGSEEDLRAGDVYYAPGGHTAVIKEDYEGIEFSPKEEFWPVMDHVAKKMKAG